MRARAAALALAHAALLGCAAEEAAPLLVAVEPALGDPGRATPVLIRGERFPVGATLGSEDPALDRLEAAYRAWLGGFALEEVRWVDERTLRAVVPRGLPEGALDLLVEAPGGARAALPSAFTVRRRAALVASLALPAAIPAGDFTVALTVGNVGGTDALAVVPDDPALAAAHTAAIALEEPAAPASAEIPVGGAVTFRWVYRAARGGAVALAARATGRDALTGEAVASAAAAAGPVAVGAPEAEALLADPFGDGTPFAQVLAHRGALLLAPSVDGRAAIWHDPSAAAPPVRLELALPRDVEASGSRSANGWVGAPPYPSLGAPGCAINTAACGPDNEEGRGLWAAGLFAGEEWLLASAQGRSGGLGHVYLSPGDAAPLAFRYVDVFGALAARPGALSAALFTADRLYLGVAAKHPALLALRTAPAAPGLDPAPGDLVELELDLVPGVGTGGQGRALPVTIDALVLHEGLLHVATAGGMARATVAAPGPWSSAPGDWMDVTPSAPEWAAHASAAPATTADLTPASRAVPALVVAGERLLAARNTVAGPQLWSCTPSRSAPVATCEASDWELVARDAPGSAGEGTLSRLGRSDLGPVTLLAEAAGWLVVGYDSPGGLQLFRAPAASALRGEDFTGLAGCAALAAGCEGLAGPGLGRGAGLPRILDGRALAPGGVPTLYLVAGDRAAPARLYRIVLEPT